ncbi:LacI family DNA-binding transcriptional regulator [Microlunatus speluncae]|uniref:LacI family DNA-binding transcriptional regulator n=1 Tax=Microlunatus speluncae TaxID=2594267 RepID=UPI00126617A5|nr:LacI family DNA-binding transcriptional regulator [Microlunatus speluncae]
MTRRRQPVSAKSAAAKLETIARRAGVSVSTVSRVLNARANVSPEARQRVQPLLEAAGYEIKLVDRRTPQLVDLVVPNFKSPYLAALFRALDEAAAQRSVSIVLTNRDAGANWLALISRRQSRGVVLAVIDLADRETAWLEENALPYLLIDPAHLPQSDTPWITADHRAAARTATDHLITLGHRRLAFINSISALAGVERELGFHDQLAAAGLAAGPVERCDSSAAGAAAALRRLLDRPDPPTAIVASHDDLATRLLAAALGAGLRIPDQLSVVGFDDIPEAARFVPPVTTLASPLGAIAEQTLDYILGPTPQRFTELRQGVRLPMTLRVRSSTGPAEPD